MGSDFLAALPGEGTVFGAIQLAAAGVGFVDSLAKSDATGAVGSVLVGQTAGVDIAATRLGVDSLEAVPIVGNIMGVGLLVRDVLKVGDEFDACMGES